VRDREREALEAQRLTIVRAALPQDAAALATQDAIDALTMHRAVVLQAIEDLPKVQANAAAQRAKVSDAIEELGLMLAPEAAREALPAAVARRTVQRLINQHATLSTEAKSAARELAAGKRQSDQAALALAAAPEPASPALLRGTIDAVRGEGRLDAELVRAQSALTRAEAKAGAALAALPVWTDDMTKLAACPLPLPAEANRIAAQLDAAAQALSRDRADAAELARDIASVEEDLSRLARGETVPTPDAVAAARAARDRVWRIVRRVLQGGPSSPAEELPIAPLPDAFETLRDEADQLADRRADEAQRVADFLSASARLDLLCQRRETLQSMLATSAIVAAQAESSWRALWAPASIEPLAPQAMVEWRRSRTEVLQLAEAAAAARQQYDDLTAQRDQALAALAALLPDAPAPESLAARLLRAETACAAAEAAMTEYRTRKQALADAERRLPELRQAVDAAASALDSWQQAWSAAIAMLTLPPDAPIETAETALAAWARIAESVPAWRTDEGRIAAMTASINDFSAQVRVLREQVGETASDEPAPLSAGRLARRLAEARKAAADADDLGKRIGQHETAAAEAARRLMAAEEELGVLRRLAGVADDAALGQAIERARQRNAIAAVVARIEQDLRMQGDGIPEPALRAEAGQIGHDAVVGRLAAIDSELDTLGGTTGGIECATHQIGSRAGRDARRP
jgi:hypothetical protein